MVSSKKPSQRKPALVLSLPLFYTVISGQYLNFTDISRKAPIDLCRAWIFPNESNSALSLICLEELH